MFEIYNMDKTMKPLGPKGFRGQTGMEPIGGLKMTFAMSLCPSIGWKRVLFFAFCGSWSLLLGHQLILAALWPNTATM